MRILGFEWLRNVLQIAPCAAVSQPGLQSPPAPGHLHWVMGFVLARRHWEEVTRAEEALGPWPSASCWLEAAPIATWPGGSGCIGQTLVLSATGKNHRILHGPLKQQETVSRESAQTYRPPSAWVSISLDFLQVQNYEFLLHTLFAVF